MNEEEFKETLLKKLDLNNRLLALALVKDKSSLTEKIEELSFSGFGPSDIANILGTSANYVNVALNRIRKKQKKEKLAEESSIVESGSQKQEQEDVIVSDENIKEV